MAISIK